MLLHADAVVVTLERYRRYLVARYGARNVTHIPHGLWQPPEREEEPERETVLVFGTFGPHKDPGLVAEAVARLRRSRPDLRLIVAGADHPRYPGFMARCSERHGLGADWIGYVARDELRSLFARATVVVDAREQDLRLDWFRPGDVADLARALAALLDERERRVALVAHNLGTLERVGPARTAAAYLSVFARSAARFEGGRERRSAATTRAIEVLADR
jgi:glycosyltransferase involved in cell wall biosynthesis